MTTSDPNTRLPSAISTDGSMAAIVASSTSTRHLIQIYQLNGTASSCSLQSTLTHSSNNEQLTELIFCGSSLLVALFGSVEVVVWDLDRGVVAHKYRTEDDESSFLALASCPAALSESDSAPSFYILARYGPKLYTQGYKNGKISRRIKSGKWDGEDDNNNKIWGLVITKDYIVVKGSGGIRIMKLENAKKVGKIPNKGASGRMDVTGSTLAVLESAGGAVLYSLPDGKELARISHELSSEAAHHTSFQVESKKGGSDYRLLIDSVLYNVTGSKCDQLTRLTTSSSTVAAVFVCKQKLLALVNKVGGCRASWLDLENDNDIPATLNLDNKQKEEEEVDEAKSKPSKRKNNQPVMLGPGQDGVEPPQPALKKAKVEKKKEDDVEKNMSIAERLQKMAELDDDDDDDTGVPKVNTSFKPKTATTESLKELLTQVLQSGGSEGMLELALQVRDEQMIARTMRDIHDPSLVQKLCNRLTSKLASSPMRAELLQFWISQCLKTGKCRPEQLMPLRNLVYERIETYPDMLRLKGRLQAMSDAKLN